MTQEQKEEIDATIAYVRSVNDVLEKHELRLRDFGDVKANPSDPYSIDVADAANAIADARDILMDQVLGFLGELSQAKIEEVENA